MPGEQKGACSVWLMWPLLGLCCHYYLAALPAAALASPSHHRLCADFGQHARCAVPLSSFKPPHIPTHHRDHAQREAAELAAARSAALHAEEQRAATWAAAPQVNAGLGLAGG